MRARGLHWAFSSITGRKESIRTSIWAPWSIAPVAVVHGRADGGRRGQDHRADAHAADYGFSFRDVSSLRKPVDSTLLLLREDGICDRQRARVAARSGQAMASPVELASAGATRAESAASNAPTAMVLAAASLLGPAKAMKSWTNALGSDKTGAARWVMRPAW